MNVREEQLRTYIEVFCSTLQRTAKDYLAKEYHKELLHISLLPAKITGYVSTNYGVAMEYVPAKDTQITTKGGSGRVEDLLVKAPRRQRNSKEFVRIAGRNTVFDGCRFSGRFPFRLTGKEASVVLRRVLFEAGAWTRAIHYAEIYGDRSSENWSREKAVSRAKDEVLAALVHIDRAQKRKISVSEYIESFKEKGVLVLGDYDDGNGFTRLQGISRVLTDLGYDPLLIKDIPDHPHQDLTQKVVAIGSIARFVMVEDSSKSGHLFEVPLCKQNNWVTVLLRCHGSAGSWMTAGASHQSKVILEQSYDPKAPKKSLIAATKWAEGKLIELKTKFDGTYPWRGKSR